MAVSLWKVHFLLMTIGVVVAVMKCLRLGHGYLAIDGLDGRVTKQCRKGVADE